MKVAAELRSYRPVIIGAHGAVAANHPLAAQAGLLVLRAGGNAVDAAVATAVTLAVVEPMMSGLGGDGFYHVWDQAAGRAVVFNGTGPAPAAATPDRYAGRIPRTGPLSVSVPGTVSALGKMHRAYGRLPWPDLFAEAIAFARDGFGATRAYTHFAEEYRTTLLVDPRSAATFLNGGEPPPLGTAVLQPDLACTLEEIALDGADSFYRGRLARRLAASLEGAGCLVSAADLEAFSADQQDPIAIDYRGFTVLEAPPNSTGFVLLEELKILEQFDLAGMGLLSADAVHVMVEAKKLAFADRERWGADPHSIEAPLAQLLSTDYTRGPDRPHGPCRRRHDLFLHRRWRGQCRFRRAEHQQRLRFRCHGGRHRDPAQQPDELLAPRARPSQPAAARSSGQAYNEPAIGSKGRRALVRLRHTWRRQPGADQSAGLDRNDRFQARPAASC
jgi:gamma-glutamyltranspeptidase/glutathione hydrolase